MQALWRSIRASLSSPNFTFDRPAGSRAMTSSSPGYDERGWRATSAAMYGW
jgi:hypothetical protein